MSPELKQRPKWEIDRILEGLLDHDVRVATRAFSPATGAGGNAPRFIHVQNLFLPDNGQPAGSPVFFEGRLQRFERQIAVVYAWLGSVSSLETASDGLRCFRGKTAAIVRGPAIVELAFPFRVERLPADATNYWHDLRASCAQFWLPFPPAGNDDKTRRS